MMKTIGTKLAAVVLAIGALSAPALAGKGGSNASIVAAVQSGSQDAVIAEVERTEALLCRECVATVTTLTQDTRYPVREVAAWWFSKRPDLRAQMANQMMSDVIGGDSVRVRNAADFLGAAVYYNAIPALQTAMGNGSLATDAKLAIVRAVGRIASMKGNPALQIAMADSDPQVRAAAIRAWRDMLHQTSVTVVEPLLSDGDAHVRANAATVVGAYRDLASRSTLEQLVVTDADPFVRRNAAWALGQIGAMASRQALTTASADKSGLVKLVAKASLSSLKY